MSLASLQVEVHDTLKASANSNQFKNEKSMALQMNPASISNKVSATQSHISHYNGIGYYLLYLLFVDVAKKLYLEA